MKSLEGSYNIKECEQKWQNEWKKSKIYAWHKDEKREDSFVVDTPPPTVSGQLHMGHIFSYTQTDFIVRYQRMIGKNIFFPMGFDDNGLPTERLVEKQKGIKAVHTDRQEFINICESVVDEEEKKFESLFSSMALSVDWDLKFQSVSKNSTTISQMSFLDLVKKGEIYRAEQPVLWDPVDQTALAQADIEDKEKDSEMHDILFKGEDGSELVIATTRPELIPACVGMLYNPSDKRYKHLEGKYAISPIFNIKVPIIADESVSIDKGTGLVMCCTFGDTTDIVWWQKYKLDLKVILDKRGRIIEGLEFPSEEGRKLFSSMIGLKVNEARAKIVEIFKERNLLLKSVPVKHVTKCAERSGAPLEIITAPQWFVRTINHKEALLKRSEELNWYPKTMKIKLDNWINSISWDWCISRQRFFGVPFPVWYSKRAGEEGKIIFADKNQLPVDPLKDLPLGYSKEEVIPDMDVMDTWATSSVSPQLSSRAINEEFSVDIEKHNKLFPFDLRPQAHEILRTWAFYTILKSHLHQNTLPWKNIMISGWCLAEDKTKMSKSKGNIISPVSLIENYGADVIRYWASTSRLGADTAFSEELLKIGKKLVNKIWNAAKFASIHFEKIKIQRISLEEAINKKIIHRTMDLWLISKLQSTIKKSTEALNKYEYAEARECIEAFFWKDFCDNYLEISKQRCYDEEGSDKPGQESAIYTLSFVLEIVLKLFAPYIPHITEEIYSTIYGEKSVHERNNWPSIHNNFNYREIEIIGDNFIKILDLVRKVKASKNLSMKTSIEKMELDINLALTPDAIVDLKNVTNTITIAEVMHFDKDLEIVSDDFISLAIRVN